MASCFICCNEIPEVKLDEEEGRYNEHDYCVDKDTEFQTKASLTILKLLVDMFRPQLPTGYKITMNKYANFCFGCSATITRWESVLKEILELQQLIEKQFQKMSNLKEGIEEVFQEFNHGTVMNKLKTRKLVSPPGFADVSVQIVQTSPSSYKIRKRVQRPGRPLESSIVETTLTVIRSQQRPQTRGFLGTLPRKRYVDERPNVEQACPFPERSHSEDDDFNPLSAAEDDSGDDSSVTVSIPKKDEESLKETETVALRDKPEGPHEVPPIVPESARIEKIDSLATVHEGSAETGDVTNPEGTDSSQVSTGTALTEENGDPASDIQVSKKRGRRRKGIKSLPSVPKKMEASGENLFECDLCHKKLRSKNSLDIHKQIHTGEKRFECTYCHKFFRHRPALRVHVRSIHTGEKPYKCQQCPAAHASWSALEYHKLTHSGERPHACNICGKRFPLAGTLREHMLKHKEEKPFACKFCPNRYVTPGGARLHQRTHTQGKQYLCNFCPKQFLTKALLQNHIRKHTQDNPFACDICDKRFHVKSCLKSHYRNHTGEKQYLCYLCGKQYSDHKSFKKHKLLHEQEKSFQCELCDDKFTTADDCRKHQETHSLKNPNIVQETAVDDSEHSSTSPLKETSVEDSENPSTSPFKEASVKDLENNLRSPETEFSAEDSEGSSEIPDTEISVNDSENTSEIPETETAWSGRPPTKKRKKRQTGKKAFPRDTCGKIFTQKENLSTHKRLHTDKKRFHCQLCPQQFKQKRDLLRHVTRIHEKPVVVTVDYERDEAGKRIYRCGVCDKTYSARGNLQTHKRIHAPVRDFRCEICEKDFVQKTALERHMLTHTGMKPFLCVLCGKGLTTKAILVKHMRVIHGQSKSEQP